MLPPPPRSTLFPYTTLFRSRTEKLFTKKYEEETNLRCQFVLDASSSMYFQQEDNWSKLKYSIYGIAADRKSTRLNSSHVRISYAVFCLKKKKKNKKSINNTN